MMSSFLFEIKRVLFTFLEGYSDGNMDYVMEEGGN